MKSDKELEKMVAGLDVKMKKSSRKTVALYARGMEEGMHMAYVAAAKQMLGRGDSDMDVRLVLGGLMDEDALEEVMAEAHNR